MHNCFLKDTITVKSKQNEGSTFSVEMPMRVMDEEAIKKYNEDNKLLVVSEKNSGFENKVTIIALSANAFEEGIQKSLSIDMNAHVAKPIDVKTLLETMNNLQNKQ